MALTCPHIIWRVAPFNTTNHCVTGSFNFLNCDWRWEYCVQTTDDNEVTGEVVSIHLRRLINMSDCPFSSFSTTASIKDSDGEYHAVRILNHRIFPMTSWCVWRKSKSYILAHDVVENNVCTFSLTLEPLCYLEDPNPLLNIENHNISCLEELSGDFSKFLRHSNHADIILKCGNTEIKAHKDVLCFRSKKFREMLEERDNLEKTENLDTLSLQYMDPVVLVNLLRYIYTATLPEFTDELTRKMYEVAHEYSIDSLKKRCARLIIENLSSSDAVDVLLWADKHSDDNLKLAVSSYIACDLNILNSDEWKKFSKKYRKMAVDVFKIFTERLNRGTSPDVSIS